MIWNKIKAKAKEEYNAYTKYSMVGRMAAAKYKSNPKLEKKVSTFFGFKRKSRLI